MENGVEALRNYVWLRYNICLCHQNVRPVLDQKCLTMVEFLKKNILKSDFFKKNQQATKRDSNHPECKNITKMHKASSDYVSLITRGS